ncbi:hypothetical protein F5Y13DRAFT_205917 [Hypoxylon sp. FL1857]|nr:hypothetical protein F5Y13DRAFT_205917 [Hypoxylon sp. FL1857]
MDCANEEQDCADQDIPYSAAGPASRANIPCGEQDDSSCQAHPTDEPGPWWGRNASLDSYLTWHATDEDEWDNAANTPYEDWSGAITAAPHGGGWNNAANIPWDDENPDIPFLDLDPEDLVYGLEEATAARLAKPIER